MSAKFYYKDSDAPKPNKPNHIGVTAIIRYNGKILFEKRSDSDCWGLIGGGLKVDETLEQCLQREVYEETGLRVQEYKMLVICDDPSRIAQYPDGNVLRIITVVYECEFNEVEKLTISEESTALQFFNYEEISKLNIAKTHKHIVEEYILN